MNTQLSMKEMNEKVDTLAWSIIEILVRNSDKNFAVDDVFPIIKRVIALNSRLLNCDGNLQVFAEKIQKQLLENLELLPASIKTCEKFSLKYANTVIHTIFTLKNILDVAFVIENYGYNIKNPLLSNLLCRVSCIYDGNTASLEKAVNNLDGDFEIVDFNFAGSKFFMKFNRQKGLDITQVTVSNADTTVKVYEK